MRTTRFPAARERGKHAPSSGLEAFDRVQTLGPANVADTIGLLGEFGGWPDVVDIIVSANAAIVVFEDDAHRELARVTVAAGAPYSTQLRVHRIRALNATAAQVAVLQAVGKWTGCSKDAARDEQGY